MSSSRNNAIDPFSNSFPFSSPFLCNGTLPIPPNPNSLLNDFPYDNSFEPISDGLSVKHSNRTIENNLPTPRKKDIRSKINTSRGPRERRIRLSLNVAQRFFDLQDMLGFEKASKTLDWLLRKSGSAIQELKQMNGGYVINNGGICEENTDTQYHTSECEVLFDHTKEETKGENLSTAFAHEKRSTKSSFPLVGKESRAKARERARLRTKEKTGATSACNRMHTDSSFPVLNQIEDSYCETMTLNCSTNRNTSYFTVSEAERTCPIKDSISITRDSMKLFTSFNNANSLNNYQNWEALDLVSPRPFCYQQNIAPAEIEFPNSKSIFGGQPY